MNVHEVKNLILNSLPDAEVQVSDMTGTGDHFEVTVISRAFTGKPILEQHRIVFKALESEMDRGIHAVQVRTHAPEKT